MSADPLPTTTSSSPDHETSPTPSLSKNAQKRLLKAEHNAAIKLERRAKEKEKKRAKKRHLAAQRAAAAAAADPDPDPDPHPTSNEPPSKRQRIGPIKPFNARIVIDLGFDDKMTDKEIISLTSQLAYSYNAQRRALHPFASLLFTSLNGKTKTRLDSLSDASHLRWGHRVTWWEPSYTTLWNPPQHASQHCEQQNVVYLSADADDVLDALQEGETYIIGGLCDHNRYKNLCMEKAKTDGIRAARLPIAQYIANLPTRKVLTVNQVFEILVAWVESRDWQTAFHAVIPKRKFASPSPAITETGDPAVTLPETDEQ